MEDVLDVSTRPDDPRFPQVCLDETSVQLLAETRAPLPARPDRPARADDADERRGTANLFLVCEPLRGWRKVAATERRTKLDWAGVVKHSVDVHFPAAEKVGLVMDNLNTHGPSFRSEAFPPAEAKRLADRLEIHCTPKHGSWLNVAEIELGVLGRQGLDRRLPDRATLEREAAAWEAARNDAASPIDWQCTTEDARTKLKRPYPAVHA